MTTRTSRPRRTTAAAPLDIAAAQALLERGPARPGVSAYMEHTRQLEAALEQALGELRRARGQVLNEPEQLALFRQEEGKQQ